MEIFLSTITTELIYFSMIGMFFGVVAGAIPGLNGGMVMALTLPLTFYMNPVSAQGLLIGMYVGGTSGGLISGILIGVPGSPTSVMTTLDGHAMAKKGSASEALALGIGASFIGGMLGWAVLAFLSAPLASVALNFGNFETTALVVTGILLIAAVGSGSLSKALLAGALGALCALPGLDPIDATPRLTMGISGLQSGFGLIPVILGVFAFAPILHDLLSNRAAQSPSQGVETKNMMRHFFDALKYPVNLVRSSVIGTAIGALPGVGAAIGAIVAYSVARITSKTPEAFGKGDPDGVVSAEAANNATVMGALIPMISLGIPGSAADVILIAALTLQNVQLGPLMIVDHPQEFYGIISSAFIANIAMLLFMVLAARHLLFVLKLPKYILTPAILFFCMLGTLTYSNNPFELWIFFGFSVIGLVFLFAKIPLPAFVIGFVLTPIGEGAVRAALMESNGSLMPFITRPVPLALLSLSLLALIWAARQEIQKRSLTGSKQRGPIA